MANGWILALFLILPSHAAIASWSPTPLSAGEAIAHTFSIVARDPKTGEMGVAVQSHWFSVGAVVPWAEPGVGAVATQSLVEVSYGPRGLALMREGRSAPEALKDLLAADEQRDVRQVAMVDGKGQVSAWTGPKCIPSAGDAAGDGFSVQANLMANDRVWPSMKQAFRSAPGDLADRMLAALDAAQAVGGDIRGKQSAAILIVSGERTDTPWKGKIMDLRVEDSAKPLEELRRLVRIHRAYRFADQGDTFVSLGKMDEAMAAYARAAAADPGNVELLFWKAVGLWNAGRKDEALTVFHNVFSKQARWRELTGRLVPVGLLTATNEELERIIGKPPRGTPAGGAGR